MKYAAVLNLEIVGVNKAVYNKMCVQEFLDWVESQSDIKELPLRIAFAYFCEDYASKNIKNEMPSMVEKIDKIYQRLGVDYDSDC